MRTLLLCQALLLGTATGQTSAEQAKEPDLQDLRRWRAENRARLDRLVELRILIDLGGTVPPEVLAALLPAGTEVPTQELEAQLRAQELRINDGRDRLAAAGPDATPLLRAIGAAPVPPRVPSAAGTQEAAPPATQPLPAASRPADSRPGDSRPAPAPQSRPHSRPVGPPAVTMAKAVPSLQSVYILLQCGHVDEARAVLAGFPTGTLSPALLAYLQAGIVERTGDLDQAERTLIKAMAEETKAGRTKGPQFEAMKLALDHVTWKKNRVEFNKLLAGLDAGGQGK